MLVSVCNTERTMHSYYILFPFFIIFGVTWTHQEVVKVTLFYESLCPACREFVKKQLYPGYVQIQEVLNVDLVPYGKANQTKVNGRWKFNCQHGPKECFGNKMQACVVAQFIHLKSKVGFVGCIMSSSDPSYASNAHICASKNNIDWNLINYCLKSSVGDQLLAQFGDRTKSLKPKLSYVPHILFNGKFNVTLEDEARDDFLKTVCSLLDQKPDACSKI